MLSPGAKPQRRGGKSAKRERGDPSPPTPQAGKREVPTSGSSDLAEAESSVTAAKPPHVQEQPAVGIAHPGDILTMVPTHGKAVARSVGTQRRPHARTRVSRSLAAGSA